MRTVIRSLQVVALVLAFGRVDAAGFADNFKDWLHGLTHKPVDQNAQIIADYDLLNGQLVSSLRKDAASDNVLKALEWLKMSTGELALKPSGLKLPSQETLIKFTNLNRLMNPNNPRCDMSSYNVLTANELATGARISVTPEELHAQRRVESVIYEVALNHAIQCRWDYPEQFARARRQCDEWLLKDISRMLNVMIETSKQTIFRPRDRPLDPRHVLARRAKSITGTGKDEAKALLVHVRINAREIPEGRYLSVQPDPVRRQYWIVDQAKVVQLLERFVYSRCEFLQGAYGHIFKPAEYEQRFFSENNKYRAVNDNTAELMVWLEYYRLCKTMLANKRKLNENVFAAIWSELTPDKKG